MQKKYVKIIGLFFIATNVENVIRASMKHRDILQKKHSMKFFLSFK